MANGTETRTEMELLDDLIAGTLTDLIDDRVTSISQYAASYSDGLEYVLFPNLTNFGTYSMAYSNALEIVEVGTPLSTIDSYSFSSCPKFHSLILRGDTASALNATSPFNSTPISRKMGGVFVPADLVDTYRSRNYWKNFYIWPISEYPKAVWESITDSWEEISNSISDGTYTSKYAIGDTKSVNLGDDLGVVVMQIVAFDADNVTTGGTSAITWVALNLLPDNKQMNQTATNQNGYSETTVMKAYVDGLKTHLPTEIKSMLVAVDKTSYDKTSQSDKTDSLEIWIPSAREIYGGTSYEASGPIYTSVFSSSTLRTKYKTSATSASSWWLRTSYTNDLSFRMVGSSGSITYTNANSTTSICFGFCTGLTPASQD